MYSVEQRILEVVRCRTGLIALGASRGEAASPPPGCCAPLVTMSVISARFSQRESISKLLSSNHRLRCGGCTCRSLTLEQTGRCIKLPNVYKVTCMWMQVSMERQAYMTQASMIRFSHSTQPSPFGSHALIAFILRTCRESRMAT